MLIFISIDYHFYEVRHVVEARECFRHSAQVILKHDIHEQFYASLCGYLWRSHTFLHQSRAFAISYRPFPSLIQLLFMGLWVFRNPPKRRQSRVIKQFNSSSRFCPRTIESSSYHIIKVACCYIADHSSPRLVDGRAASCRR